MKGVDRTFVPLGKFLRWGVSSEKEVVDQDDESF